MLTALLFSATVGNRRLSRDVQLSASYLASSDPRVHFGIGHETEVFDITVRWPGGQKESFGDFKASATYELQEGNGRPLPL